MDQTPLTRRAVVAGGCGLAAAAALTACSGYGASGPVTASAPSAVPNEAASTAGGNAASPGAVAAVADVPVGGGIVLDGRLCDISASIGIAPADPAATPATAVSAADAAMYRAKRAGRNRAAR